MKGGLILKLIAEVVGFLLLVYGLFAIWKKIIG